MVLEDRGSRGRRRTTVTDGRGLYRFDRVPVGRYWVSAVKAGFARRYHGGSRDGELAATVEVGPRWQTDEVDVVLARGSVITGRVVDEGGFPMVGANVFLLQRVTQRGVVELRVARTGVTDDRGVYRVFDLEPGAYYVRGMQGTQALMAVGENEWRGMDGSLRSEGYGYAATFYPGVVVAAQARAVILRESQELGGVDFALARVPLGRVSGRVIAPPGGNPMESEARLLLAEGPRVPGGFLATWTGVGGVFAFERVPRGRYVLEATGRTGTGATAFGLQVVDVDGASVEGLSVVLSAGITVSGVVRFEGGTPSWRDVVNLQVTTALHEPVSGADEMRTTIEAGDGTFILRNLAPGRRRFGVMGLGEGRVLDRITLNGRDITDRAVTLSGGVRGTGVEIVVTDRVSELHGVVRAGRGATADRAVVVIFSSEPERWFPSSRYILTERPAQDGRYRVRGVAPGDYWVTVAPLSAAEADDWLAPRFLDRLRTGATRVSVRKGDTVGVDLQVRGR